MEKKTQVSGVAVTAALLSSPWQAFDLAKGLEGGVWRRRRRTNVFYVDFLLPRTRLRRQIGTIKSREAPSGF